MRKEEEEEYWVLGTGYWVLGIGNSTRRGEKGEWRVEGGIGSQIAVRPSSHSALGSKKYKLSM